MCVSVHVCVCVSVCICVFVFVWCVCVCVCQCPCLCVCQCVYLCVCVCVVCVCVCACVSVHVSVCISLCLSVCVCVNCHNRKIYVYTIIFFFKVNENNHTIRSYRNVSILYARVLYAILCETSFNCRVGVPSAPKLDQLGHFPAAAHEHLLMTDFGGVQRTVAYVVSVLITTFFAAAYAICRNPRRQVKHPRVRPPCSLHAPHRLCF